jgi:hypothetical protein
MKGRRNRGKEGENVLQLCPKLPNLVQKPQGILGTKLHREIQQQIDWVGIP